MNNIPTARELVLDQVEDYQDWQIFSSMDRVGVYRPGSIGETLRRLSPEEYKRLSELKSDDLANLRPRDREPGMRWLIKGADGRSYPMERRTNARVFRLPHTKA